MKSKNLPPTACMVTQALKRAEVKNSGSFLVRKIQPLGRHKKNGRG